MHDASIFLTMGNKRISFEADCVFHVYNHGNAEDIIFREEKNYDFFLKRYQKYLSAIVDTYAYCLMPNHFHFMVKIKSEEELITFFKAKNPRGLQDLEGLDGSKLSNLISNQFGSLFNSYAKSYNKIYNRRGSLFRNTFKRKQIEDDQYFTQLVRYIHLNPVKHGFVEKPEAWLHSSYNSYLSEKPSLLKREEVLDWFGGRQKFIALHNINPEDFRNPQGLNS